MNEITRQRIDQKLSDIEQLKDSYKETYCFLFSDDGGKCELRHLTHDEVKGLTLLIKRTEVDIINRYCKVFPIFESLEGIIPQEVKTLIEKRYNQSMNAFGKKRKRMYYEYSNAPFNERKARFYYDECLHFVQKLPKFPFSEEFVQDCKNEYEKYIDWVVERKRKKLEKIIETREIKYFGDDE